MHTMQFNNVCHMCIYNKIYTLPEEDGLFLKCLFLSTISFGFLNAGNREWFSVKLLWSTLYCAIQMNLIWLIVISCLWVRDKNCILDTKPQFPASLICLKSHWPAFRWAPQINRWATMKQPIKMREERVKEEDEVNGKRELNQNQSVFFLNAISSIFLMIFFDDSCKNNKLCCLLNPESWNVPLFSLIY